MRRRVAVTRARRANLGSESDAGPMSARAGKPVDTGAGSRSLVERDDGRVAGSPNCRRDRVLGPAQGCFRKRVASVIEPIPSTQRRTIATAMARVMA